MKISLSVLKKRKIKSKKNVEDTCKEPERDPVNNEPIKHTIELKKHRVQRTA